MSDHDAGTVPPDASDIPGLETLADTLRRFGYDIEPPRAGEPAARSIVARRDLGDRAVLVAVDAGGRFRIEITWIVEERATAESLAGANVRVVDTVTRAITITGEAGAVERLAAIVAALGAAANWAQPAGSRTSLPDEAEPET